MSTLFKCSRCGYENESLTSFKKHLTRKTECKPKKSDISLDDVREQYKHLLAEPINISQPVKMEHTSTPSSSPIQEKRRKKTRKLRNFGDETRDYLKRDSYKEFLVDPLKGIQEIIMEIYFNDAHEENSTVRSVEDDSDTIEIHFEDGWVKRPKIRIYDKMIYRAAEILENCISKKLWTPEFKNFITGMGEIDNDDLLELIREEVDNTILRAENELVKNNT